MELNKSNRDLFHFIYEAKNEKFSILFDANNKSLEFCYWRQYEGHSHLDEKYAFKAKRKEVFALDSDNDFVLVYKDIQRGLIARHSDYKENNNSKEFSYYKEVAIPSEVHIAGNRKNETYSLQDVNEICKKHADKALIFIGCTFKDEFDMSNLIFNHDIAFFDCTFKDKVFLKDSTFRSNLWLVDCEFSGHFSLKNSTVSRNVHMESNCFSGKGGVSFRGLKAKNLYVDFGTTGSDDMFWFNELKVSGVVSIGGHFKSKIQILSNQKYPHKYMSDTKIGELYIGTEYTDIDADEDNITTSDNTIEVGGLKAESVHVFHTSARDIKIKHSVFGKLNLEDVSISNDIEVDDNRVSSDLRINKSSIGRHMYIQKNKIHCPMSLSKTSVSEVSYIDKNIFDKAKSSIDFSRFTTSKLMFSPVSDLYKNETSSVFKLKPQKFSLLIDGANDLGDQYCSLKHWLSDTGKLKEEDMAYFHMNENFNKNSLWSRVVLGGIFGWGVRLTNIVMSSLVVILIFISVYVLYGMNFLGSVAVAVQSFFGVLLDPTVGAWTNIANENVTKGISGTDIPSWLLTLESVLGVLFITVLIGAYVRKMLR